MAGFLQGDTVSYNVAGVIAINTVLMDVDLSNATSGVSVHVVSMGTTGVVTPEMTSDPAGLTGWTGVNIVNGGGPAAPQTTMSAAGIYLIPQNAKRLRLRLSTATTAGTTTIHMTTAGENPTFAATQGALAPAAAVAGNPVRAAGVSYTANPAVKANAVVQEFMLTGIGQQVTKPYAIPESDWQFAGPIAGLTTAADTAAKAAAAAGIRNYVTCVQVQNNSATATEFQIKDGATVIWRCMCPANMPLTDIQFITPLKGTAATALNVQAVTAASVVIANLQGYIAP
jgi:hypothetical protein